MMKLTVAAGQCAQPLNIGVPADTDVLT